MVKKIFFFFFLMTCPLFSAEFIAKINRTDLSRGQNIYLQLTLQGASEKGTPLLEELRKSFAIHSEQRASSLTIVNGQMTSSMTWTFTMTPFHTGEIAIPPILIETSEGVLKSQPILIHVSDEQATQSDQKGVEIAAKISHASPYKNEPFFYTVTLHAPIEVANVQMQSVHIEDCIVEKNGDPKVYRTICNGVEGCAVEYSYMVIPLKSGSFTIPSFSMQGVVSRKKTEYDPFGYGFFSAFQGYDLQPFTIYTKEIPFDIQPSIPDMVPWIPAQSLEIEENWDESQILREGEPIMRGFTIVGCGIQANQLPNLKEMQVTGASCRVYEDKPQLENQISDGQLTSLRKEQYTLIPQKNGSLELPEITIAWWNTVTQEKMSSRIPARTLEVRPMNTIDSREELAENDFQNSITKENSKMGLLFYVLLSSAILLFFFLLSCIYFLQRRIRTLTTGSLPEKETTKRPPHPKKNKQPKKKREKLPDLNPT